MPVNNMNCENATPKVQNLVFLIKTKRFVRLKQQEYQEARSKLIYKNTKADTKYLNGKIEVCDEILEFLDLFSFEEKIRRKK